MILSDRHEPPVHSSPGAAAGSKGRLALQDQQP
jgi:hypothetical protein